LYISRTRDYIITTSSQSLITDVHQLAGTRFWLPAFLLLVRVAIKNQQTKIIHKMESVKIFSAAQHVPELRGSAFDEIAPHDVRNKSHFMI
jgi:hypothetical protein